MISFWMSDSSVLQILLVKMIGLELFGSILLPLLMIADTSAFFQSLGRFPVPRGVLKMRQSGFMPGVGLMVRVVDFGSYGPEFESRSAVELIPGGVNSACHPSKVGKMSASLLVYCVGVATRPGLCPIAKETA